MTALGGRLHFERVADETGAAVAAEAVGDLASVEEEDAVFALRVADEDLRVVDSDHEHVQPLGEIPRHLPHPGRAVLVAALAAAAPATETALAAAAEAAGGATAGRCALGSSGPAAEGLAVGLLKLLDRVLTQPLVANPDARNGDDRITRGRG